MFVFAIKLLAGGAATIALAGAGTGIGVLFGFFCLAVAINPNEERKLFSYALLGFALTEAIALFALMIVFLLLYGF